MTNSALARRGATAELSDRGIAAFDWIAHHAQRSPAASAIVEVEANRVVSYAALDERARRLAAHLTGAGLQAGDRVAILALNGAHFFELQSACVKSGLVSVPLNVRLAVAELEYIVRDATPAVLLYDVEFRSQAQLLAERCGLDHLLEIDESAASDSYRAALEAQDPAYVACRVPFTATASILYTSGTTGRPKGALLTHQMLHFNVVSCVQRASIGAGSTHLVTMPLFHIGGMNAYANPVLHSCGTVAIMRTFEPSRCLSALSDPSLGVTHYVGVPAMYQAMAAEPGFADADLSGLVTGGVGGAPCPIALLARWAERGVVLSQGFGMTETGGPALALEPVDGTRKAGSVGRPVLYWEARVLDETGADVPAGSVGELCLRGPGATPGYWGAPEASSALHAGGWLHTGDAVRVDDEGYYYVVDRTKDMYISGGENVYPAEVENVLYELDGVLECAVVGAPDERWGESGVAYVVPREGADLSADQVIAHCRESLARFKVPATVELIDELPRNASGKVLKRELRARRSR